VGRNSFVDSGAFGGRRHLALDGAGRQVAVTAVTGWEQPIVWSFNSGVFPQDCEQDRRKHDVAVLPSLSIAHVDHHADRSRCRRP